MDVRQLRQIGGYEVVRLIAEGGMSWVFEVIDPRFDVPRALKLLKPHAAAGKEFKRFEAEARVLARLDHPNIVTIYDFGRDEKTQYFYYTMTLVDGVSLADLALAPPEQTCRTVLQALAGLIEIHDAGIVHRDIKPRNILVSSQGRVFIADLGIARAAMDEPTSPAGLGDTSLTQTGMMIGTLLYSSPEQSRGQPVTKASDVFSMGLTLYKVVTGESVYDSVDEVDSTSGQQVMMYLGSLIHSGSNLALTFPDTVPRAVREVIRRACRIRPEERYPDARAMYVALEQALQAAPAGTGRSRSVGPVLIAAAGLVLAGGAAAWWWTQRETEPPRLEARSEAELQELETAREPDPVPVQVPVEETATAEEETGDELVIEAMLERAQRQFEANRLTLPARDNALETYRAILALDPEHAGAGEGIEAIRVREIELAERAEARGDLAKAHSFYRKALLAVPDDPEVLQRIDALDARIARERRAAREAARRKAERPTEREAPPKPPDPTPAGMVAVAAGPFSMGEGAGTPGSTDAFRIDRTEVTTRAYADCISAGACTETRRGRGCNLGEPGREEHPINCVNFPQAEAFCAWAGKRLPTGPEWEKAARGASGQPYPWGDEAPSCDRQVMRTRECRTTSTAPVGSMPSGASPYGALDMMGNVWEWTEDPDTKRAILRGGAWNTGPFPAHHLYPYNAQKGTPSTGFRCAQ